MNQGVIIENEEENYVYDTAYYLMPKIQNTEVTKFLLENNMRVLTMTSKGIVKEGKVDTKSLPPSSKYSFNTFKDSSE